eukprot:359832-Chlamydomonas_euryale.AAC.15
MASGREAQLGSKSLHAVGPHVLVCSCACRWLSDRIASSCQKAKIWVGRCSTCRCIRHAHLGTEIAQQKSAGECLEGDDRMHAMPRTRLDTLEDNAACMFMHVRAFMHSFDHPCTKHACLGLWSQPITPASTSAGPGPRTCMHVRAPRPEFEGHLRACMSPALSRPRPRQA